jgi:hypothetical protein
MTRTSWDGLQELEDQLEGRELQGGSRGHFNMTNLPADAGGGYDCAYLASMAIASF